MEVHVLFTCECYSGYHGLPAYFQLQFKWFKFNGERMWDGKGDETGTYWKKLSHNTKQQ